MSTNPFSEYEKRFLLAEIIKTSKVSIDTLLGIIKEGHIEPNWNEMFLPAARNMKACTAVYQELLGGNPPPPHPTSGFEPPPKTSLKRRFSDTEPSSGTSRAIQPNIQPNLQPKLTANGAQFAAPARSPAEITTKKRGRPTKEVLDARRAEAAARGTIYPPLKAAGRKSIGESLGAQMGFGFEGPPSEPGPKTGGSIDSPTSRKRRGRPTREEADARKIMPTAYQVAEAPQVPRGEGKDIPPHAFDALEGVERTPGPTPPAVSSGSAAQVNSETIGPPTAEQPPLDQLLPVTQ